MKANLSVMELITAKAAASRDMSAMVPGTSSRPEMFLNTENGAHGVTRPTLRAVDFVEPGPTGDHPKTSVRIYRDGQVPTNRVIFYRQ